MMLYVGGKKVYTQRKLKLALTILKGITRTFCKQLPHHIHYLAAGADYSPLSKIIDEQAVWYCSAIAAQLHNSTQQFNLVRRHSAVESVAVTGRQSMFSWLHSASVQRIVWNESARMHHVAYTNNTDWDNCRWQIIVEHLDLISDTSPNILQFHQLYREFAVM